MTQHRPDSPDLFASPHRDPDAPGDRAGVVGEAFEAFGETLDADLRAVIAALDADGAERLARDLPPGLVERITMASTAHLPSVPELLHLDTADAHAAASHTGVWAPSVMPSSAARRHLAPLHGRRDRAFGASRLGLSIRSVLSMAAAIGLAFVAATPFVTSSLSLTASRTSERLRSGEAIASSQNGFGRAEETPFSIAASSRNESTLVVLLQDRRAGGGSDEIGSGGSPGRRFASSIDLPAASAAFANLRVFPISAEPTTELTSLLDVRDTDVGDLVEEFSRIQRATAPRAR